MRRFRVDYAVVDAVWDVLVGWFATAALGKFCCLGLGLLLLRNLGLSKRYSRVRPSRHHRTYETVSTRIIELIVQMDDEPMPPRRGLVACGDL